MPELGRAALVATLGLAVYAVVAGSYAAWKGRRRLALSAQNALIGGVRDERRRLARPRRGADPARLLVRLRRRAHEPRAAHRLHDLGLLGRAGGLAPALAADPDRLLDRRPAREPAHRPRPRRLGDARARRRHRLLRVPARRRRDAVRDAGGAGGRQRAQPEPPEPVHDGPPAAALPRLRRPHRPVRLRDGSAARTSQRRALDHRDAPVDARRVDGARRRPAARLALGLPGGRLGRLLRLGPGRERRPDAVARGDGVPALGDDPGEARDAARLEPPARGDGVLRSRSSGRS